MERSLKQKQQEKIWAGLSKDRIAVLHARATQNPNKPDSKTFLDWHARFHGGLSVKGVDTYKKSERLKRLEKQSKSGAGYDLKDPESSGRDTIVPLTSDQRAKIAEVEKQKRAADKAAKAAEKKKRRAERITTPRKPSIKSKEDRLSFIKAAFSRAKSPARQAKFDVPTLDNQDDHDDLRDVHQGLHITRGYNEEASPMIKPPTNRFDKKSDAFAHADKHGGKVYKQTYTDSKGQQTVSYSVKKEEFELDEAKRMSAAVKLGRAFDRAKAESETSRRRGQELMQQIRDKQKEKESKKIEESKDQEEPPFTPDKKKIRRGPGGPMSQVKWLARQAMKKAAEKKEKVEEAVKDQADVGEYDYEGDMAKSQLRSIMTNAKRMHDMLEDTTNLPEWVQSKITLAEDYVLTAANYMEGEMNEEVEQVNEKAKNPYAIGMAAAMKSTGDKPPLEKSTIVKAHDIAKKVMAKEEVEQIDELKKSTLASYVNKAANQVRAKSGIAASFETQGERKRDPERKASYMSLAKDYRKGARQRLTGIEKATAKLAREEVETVEEGKDDWKKAFDKVAQKNLNKDTSQLKQKVKKLEPVAESEGSTPTTPKEKELAAHHGDKGKITFGDVLKARLKSAAARTNG